MICSPTRNASVITEDITRYMSDIEGYKRITKEKEIELANKIREGSAEERQQARDELICSNLKLVVKIAHDFKRYGMTFADIVAEGNRGLMTAADKFQPGHGAKFSCYATWWIKQSIRKALAEQTHTIRIPGGATQKVLNLAKVKLSFANEFNREPSDEEVRGITGLSEKQLENIKRADLKVYSIEASVNEDDSSRTTFGEFIGDSYDDGAQEKSNVDFAVSALNESLKDLPERDRYILIHMYGLGGAKMLDEDTICQEVGLPITRLHIKLRRLQGKLKEILQADGVDF